MEEIGLGNNSFHKLRLQNYFSYQNSVVYEGTTFFKYRKVKKHPYPAHIHRLIHIYLHISSGEVTQSRNTEAKNKESFEAFDPFCQVAFQNRKGEFSFLAKRPCISD